MRDEPAEAWTRGQAIRARRRKCLALLPSGSDAVHMLPLPGAWPRGSVASSPVDARRALLGRLIDHAALFPPASLPVLDALAEDRRARASEHAWMLGRFVCPASKLAELGGEERALTVVADAPADDPRIESIETRMLARYAGELDERSFRWAGREAASRQLARVRETLFHSIGSCSFFEPVEELQALGILS